MNSNMDSEHIIYSGHKEVITMAVIKLSREFGSEGIYLGKKVQIHLVIDLYSKDKSVSFYKIQIMGKQIRI